MADSPVPAEGSVQVASEQSPREKTPVSEPSKITAARHSVAQREHAKKRKHSSSKSKRGKKAKRSKFSGRYSSSSSASESSDSSSSSLDSNSSDVSNRNTLTPHVMNESAFGESEAPLDQTIVDFAAESAFQGLSKSARKNMLKESPVPLHADLRPKKVDSFVKKYLKRNGTAFNPVMDRRMMNIAGRILDPLGPLAQLWQDALAAEAGKTGLEPASVIELVRRAIALTGNASYCALVDRRKGLLAKVSSDSLDLIDDPELFVPDSSDLFGKKFKKAFLKELKLSKELDSLVRGKYHGNAHKQKPFRRQPGRGPGSSTNVQSNYRRGRFPYRQGKAGSQFPRQGNKN